MSPARTPPRQSDIIIRPDGSVAISFFWNDLAQAATTEPVTLGASSGPPDFPLEEYRKCEACPHQCGFDRVARRHPRCGDHQLRVATAGLTMGDEPEIRGTRGSGAVMLSGCPLRCPSCHNPEMVADGEPFTVAELVALAWSLAGQGAHNLQLLSPTVHFPALEVALRRLREEAFPIPVIFKSSGYERIEWLRRFEGLVDVYLPDFKFGPCSSWGKRAGAKDYFEVASDAVAEMFRQVGGAVLAEDGTIRRGVLVRHVLAPLPGPERETILAFLRGLPEGTRVSVLDTFVDLLGEETVVTSPAGPASEYPST